MQERGLISEVVRLINPPSAEDDQLNYPDEMAIVPYGSYESGEQSIGASLDALLMDDQEFLISLKGPTSYAIGCIVWSFLCGACDGLLQVWMRTSVSMQHVWSMQTASHPTNVCVHVSTVHVIKR